MVDVGGKHPYLDHGRYGEHLGSGSVRGLLELVTQRVDGEQKNGVWGGRREQQLRVNFPAASRRPVSVHAFILHFTAGEHLESGFSPNKKSPPARHLAERETVRSHPVWLGSVGNEVVENGEQGVRFQRCKYDIEKNTWMRVCSELVKSGTISMLPSSTMPHGLGKHACRHPLIKTKPAAPGGSSCVTCLSARWTADRQTKENRISVHAALPSHV